MAGKKKQCSFCGEFFYSNDTNVTLFKSTDDDGHDIRICSNCIQRCSELYNAKMAKKKAAQIEGTAIEMTPQKIYELLNEYVLDQEFAMKKIAKEYYNHLKRLKRYDSDNDCNKKLRIDKSNMIYMGKTGSGRVNSQI